MSNVKDLIADNIDAIVEDLNKELLSDRIVRFWQKVDSNLTLDELVTRHWQVRSEFTVDLGVSFGKIFELYLPFKLKSLGLNVEPIFTSEGDMVENGVSGTSILYKWRKNWEIKTGRGKFIQGATHSPKEKKPLNLIQVLWDCHWNKTLTEIREDGQFIKELNICVFDNIVVNSVGEHSDNNSRTTLQFTKDRYDECVDACVYASIKKNRVNVGYVKEDAYGG